MRKVFGLQFTHGCGHSFFAGGKRGRSTPKASGRPSVAILSLYVSLLSLFMLRPRGLRSVESSVGIEVAPHSFFWQETQRF